MVVYVPIMIWVTAVPLGPDTIVPLILEAVILETARVEAVMVDPMILEMLRVEAVMVEAIMDDTVVLELLIEAP